MNLFCRMENDKKWNHENEKLLEMRKDNKKYILIIVKVVKNH